MQTLFRKARTRWAVALFAGLLNAGLAGTDSVDEKYFTTSESTIDSEAVSSAPIVPGRVLVKFREGTHPAVVNLITTALDLRVEDAIPELGVLFVQVPDGASERDYADLLKRFSAVEYAELDYLLQPSSYFSTLVIPNDPLFDLNTSYNYGWHLTRIGAPAAWYYQRGSPQIVIAIIDGGVNPVPDLVSRLVPGWNFYDGNRDTRDIDGHGTAVAGVVGAATNNGIGVAGVTWGCRIMPIRVAAPNGNGSYGVIAQALVWAANNGARVAAVSWAMSTYDNRSEGNRLVTDAARYFMERARGVVTMPSGNDGLPITGNPPDNPYILRVGAISREHQRAPFSNYGSDLDLVAPGDEIITTTRTGSYTLAGGTSFSHPIVAGVAALMLSANPYLTGERVQSILQQTAVDMGPPGWDWEYGWGCVNAYRAVMVARGLSPERTPPSVRITSHRNGEVVSGAFWISCEASDPTGISHVEIYVDDTRLTWRLNEPYRVWWNSLTVPPGWHTLSAVAHDGAGNRGVHAIQIYVNNPEDRYPPTVQITAINGQPPVDGMVLQGDGLVVEVDARDDVGVVRAELYVDGVRRYTTTAPPFTFRGSTGSWSSGEHTLRVRVYDGAGRTGDSQLVRVIKP